MERSFGLSGDPVEDLLVSLDHRPGEISTSGARTRVAGMSRAADLSTFADLVGGEILNWSRVDARVTRDD
jgi:hypothetical protein